MADIKICDKCGKRLGYRKNLLFLKPSVRKLTVQLYKSDPWNIIDSGKSRMFELCDDCANELSEFLGIRNKKATDA